MNHSVSISVSGVTQFQLVPGTFPHSGVSVANASTQPNAAAGSRETAAPCRVSPPHIASPATAASAISSGEMRTAVTPVFSSAALQNIANPKMESAIISNPRIFPPFFIEISPFRSLFAYNILFHHWLHLLFNFFNFSI